MKTPSIGAICTQCLGDADAQIVGMIKAIDDPEGIARLDVVITCAAHGRQYNYFIPIPGLVQLCDEVDV